MAAVTPYLFFDGNCRAAMTFYRECLGGELILNTVGDTPAAGQFPADARDKIIHAALRRGAPPEAILMASDWMSQNTRVPGNNVSLSINCSSAEEIQTLFSALSPGATITQPPADMFWGATYGSLVDRFGIAWMLNFEKSR